MADDAGVSPEAFLRMGREVLASQAFSTLLGAELHALEPGRVELHVPIRDVLLQQNGFAHGGVVSYLADNALTFAGGTALHGSAVLTSEFKINYLRPAVGQRLIARARAVHAGKSQAVCVCEVFAVQDGKEKLCALAQGTIARVSDPSSTTAP